MAVKTECGKTESGPYVSTMFTLKNGVEIDVTTHMGKDGEFAFNSLEAKMKPYNTVNLLIHRYGNVGVRTFRVSNRLGIPANSTEKMLG